jgi:hypothetical protein
MGRGGANEDDEADRVSGMSGLHQGDLRDSGSAAGRQRIAPWTLVAPPEGLMTADKYVCVE